MRDIASETLALLEKGRYQAPSGAEVDFSDRQRKSVDGTRLYTPEQLAGLVARDLPSTGAGVVKVVNASTQMAAQKLASDGGDDLMLLNFASAINPGGGFLLGARAQEEDLCRCSGLYPTLLTQPTYYEANDANRSSLYLDYMIYSPGVTFFRTRSEGKFLERPFVASIVTAPAPNARPLVTQDPSTPSLARTFDRRWRYVLAIAAAQRHRNVLLGAWGCGAFGNDPEVVAESAAMALNDYTRAFDQVVFAIPGDGQQSRLNLECFQTRLDR